MTAKEIVAQVTNLPVLPQATMKLLRLLDDPSRNTQAALDLIQTDAVLSAKLLRLCNSAAIGLREPVASVDQAIFFLGFSEVQRLALALSLGGSLNRKSKNDAFDARELWRHSVVAAHAGATIATNVRKPTADPSVVFTAALMHDIGKLVLAEALTLPQLAEIRRLVQDGRATCEAERTVLGADHAAVGACLLESWRMPKSLIEPVANHHQPVFQPEPALSVLVHLANCYAHQTCAIPEWNAFSSGANQAAAAAVGFGAEELESTSETLLGQVEKIEQFALAA